MTRPRSFCPYGVHKGAGRGYNKNAMQSLESLTLEKCRERLLELGKRNRLYAYVEGERHLPILAPSLDELYRLFESGEKAYLYDLDNALSKRDIPYSLFLVKDDADREEEVARAETLGEIFLCPTRAKKLSRMVKNLSSFAKSSIEERGINVLYLALGFLSWKEGDEKETPLLSPILLLPVSLIKEGTRFALQAYGEETERKNSTLALALKNQYGLDLPTLERGEKVSAYLARLQEYFSRQEGWQVREEASLGLFSFAKLDSYEDLKENEEKILESPLVQQLFAPGAIRVASKAKKDKGNLPLVLSADASQREALRAFKKGETFVLDGPPGTGKSQTIANLIALALRENKRVLFVSEKKAALDVVYDKLEKTGLGGFCLNLHGGDLSRGEIYRDIKKSIDCAVSSQGEFDPAPEKDLAKARKKLLDYDNKLHSSYPGLGISPYEAFSYRVSYASAPKVDFYFESISDYPYPRFASCVKTLGELEKGFFRFGRDIEEQPFYGYRHGASYEEKMALEKRLEASRRFVGELLSLSEEFPALPLGELRLRDFPTYVSELREIRDFPYRDPALFEPSKKEAIRRLESEARAKESAREEAKKAVLECLLRLPKPEEGERFKRMEAYRGVFRSLSKQYRLDKKALRPLFKKKPKYRDFLSALALLERYGASVKEYADALSALASFFSTPGKKEDVRAACEMALRLEADHRSLRDDPTLPEQVHDRAREKGIRESDFALFEEWADAFDPLKKEIAFYGLAEMEEFLAEAEAALPTLPDYLAFLARFDEAEAEGIAPFVEEYRLSVAPIEEMKRAFSRVYFTQWSDKILAAEPKLASFSSSSALERYEEAAKKIFAFHQEEIVRALSSRIPKKSEEEEDVSSRLGALYRLVSKKKSLPAIRQVLDDYFDELSYVKPVFLMSPLSVSTYLSSDAHFDVVIFDEASQVFPFDAIGALYRADQAVISGDDKQMPPSHYFQSGYVEEEDGELSGYESILDYFASYPHFRLLYHYRSLNESLISFSSRVFYDDALVTFPGPEAQKQGSGVAFHYVENAIYNRKSGCNLKEAKEVASLAYAHYRNSPSTSLGIVAFSMSQQEAIDDCLDELRARDEAFSAWLETREEPFFLKNLESVQGDERDHIILSLGYGYDKDGKFLHSFGPLNVEGGERRLNVAISRARKALTFVASIHSFDIDLSRVSSRGPKILRDYLSFCESGALPEGNAPAPSPLDDPILLDLQEELRKRGYDSTAYLGNSAFRVDLAIREKGGSRYALGVLTDRESYRLDLSPYDRDLLRVETLQSHGWKIFRLYAPDYLLRKEETIAAILGALEAPQEATPDAPEEEAREEPPSLGVSFPPFLPCDLSPYLSSPLQKALDPSTLLKKAIPAILRAEQPVTKKRLLNLATLLCNRKKATKKIVADVDDILASLRYLKEEGDALFLTALPKDLTLRVYPERDFEEIPLLELKQGILALVSAYDRFDEESLFATLIRYFGYTRMSKTLKARLASALEELKEEEAIYVDFRGYFAKEGE